MQQRQSRAGWLKPVVWALVAYAIAAGLIYLMGVGYAGMSSKEALGFGLGVGAFVSGLTATLTGVGRFASEADAGH